MAGIKNINYLYGTDSISREEEADRMIAELLGEDGVEDSLTIIYPSDGSGREGPSSKILSAATNVGMFTEKQIIRVKHADKLKTEDQNALCSYLGAPNDVTYIVFEAETLSRKTKFGKLLKTGDRINVKEFLLPPPYKMEEWVAGRAASHGKRLSTESAALLIEKTGHDPRQIDMRLKTLADSSGEKKVISYEDIENNISDSRVCSPWDINSYIAAKDLAGAFNMIGAFYRNNIYFPTVIASVFRFIKDLYNIRKYCLANRDAARKYVRGGGGFEFRKKFAAAAALYAGIISSESDRSVYPKVVKAGLIENSANFTLTELEKTIHYITLFDTEYKTGKAGHDRNSMEFFIARVIFPEKAPNRSLWKEPAFG
ncbi:MAG: DNA polymerase III subunit delta [Fibrobacterota bacterium]